MAMPTRTDGDDGDRGFSHSKDCPDALPLQIDPQELDGAGQTSEQWRQENRQALKRYNKRVQEHGVFSDGVRCF
ncbi:type II toxin-antitoxin system CcdA family antitoxin [Pseudomonas sp. S75]|uniref:type II toxin-antitoxin system CcdA family antitoxin n=1 Tax=unclassified Pseudomonas TaxID=196821 RepID=UPI001902D170|nr:MULTISPECIES: type II toxin-antitoxin system CcdA family antitoxin [unclassified Pseudomonas]MBJ9976916.1 type II toxin-antitoxin system CcdA family antitoxin [Pseudomonas sp. S30]MBK0153809.1 type II toxin-antitoxin system CcdA family antitoxin [Pseudomonas sp. S75]